MSRAVVDANAPTTSFQVPVFEVGDLVGGFHEVRLVHLGETGTYSIIDALFVGDEVARLGDDVFTYDGLWRSSVARVYDGGSATVTSLSGSVASFAFEGPIVRLIGSTGPSRGSFEVTIDGQPMGTINANRAANAYLVGILTASALAEGTHVLTVRHVGPEGLLTVLDGVESAVRS